MHHEEYLLIGNHNFNISTSNIFIIVIKMNTYLTTSGWFDIEINCFEVVWFKLFESVTKKPASITQTASVNSTSWKTIPVKTEFFIYLLNLLRLSGRLASLGLMGAQLRALLKALNTIVL